MHLKYLLEESRNAAPSKLDPSTVASKKEAPTKSEFLKLASRTTVCWKATPFRLELEKSERSKFTPRVMVMVPPLWRVDAPPVVILEFESTSAPPEAACAGTIEVASSCNANNAERGTWSGKPLLFLRASTSVLSNASWLGLRASLSLLVW